FARCVTPWLRSTTPEFLRAKRVRTPARVSERGVSEAPMSLCVVCRAVLVACRGDVNEQLSEKLGKTVYRRVYTCVNACVKCGKHEQTAPRWDACAGCQGQKGPLKAAPQYRLPAGMMPEQAWTVKAKVALHELR